MSATMSSLSAHLELNTNAEEGVEQKRMMKTAEEVLMKLPNVLCFADFSGETTVLLFCEMKEVCKWS